PESAEMLAGRPVPNVRVTAVAARNDPTAVGGDEDLRDAAITGLGRQRLAGGRVPAVDGMRDRGRQRLAAIREVKLPGSAVDSQPLFAGCCVVQMDRTEGGGHRPAIRRESHTAPVGNLVSVLRERAPLFAGVYIKESEENAGLGAKGGERFPVGRECE